MCSSSMLEPSYLRSRFNLSQSLDNTHPTHVVITYLEIRWYSHEVWILQFRRTSNKEPSHFSSGACRQWSPRWHNNSVHTRRRGQRYITITFCPTSVPTINRQNFDKHLWPRQQSIWKKEQHLNASTLFQSKYTNLKSITYTWNPMHTNGNTREYLKEQKCWYKIIDKVIGFMQEIY